MAQGYETIAGNGAGANGFPCAGISRARVRCVGGRGGISLARVSDTVTRENVRSVRVNNGKKVSERTIPRNAEEQRGRHKLG
jgi:hypothetical protein